MLLLVVTKHSTWFCHLEFNGFVFISTINIRQTQTYMTKVKPKKTWKHTLSFRAMGNVKGWRKKRTGTHCGKLAPTLVFLVEWVAKRHLNIMHLKEFSTVGDHQHHQHHKQHLPIFANFTAQDGFHPGVSHTSEENCETTIQKPFNIRHFLPVDISSTQHFPLIRRGSHGLWHRPQWSCGVDGAWHTKRSEILEVYVSSTTTPPLVGEELGKSPLRHQPSQTTTNIYISKSGDFSKSGNGVLFYWLKNIQESWNSIIAGLTVLD